MTQLEGDGAIDTAVGHMKLGRTLLREKKFAEAKFQTKLGYDVLLKQVPRRFFFRLRSQDLAAEEAALSARKASAVYAGKY